MKHTFGIRKTKTNIFWLFVVGLIVGVVMGLRQPAGAVQAPVVGSASVQEIQK